MQTKYESRKSLFRSCYICSIVLLLGCAGPADMASNHTPATQASYFNDATSAALVNSDQSLNALWASRVDGVHDNPRVEGFAMGPGDLLRVSVPQMEELKQREVRVSESDTVSLPLLGEINVSGMTEENLRAELLHRLAKYMRHPQIDLLVEHTENREVAVLGSVAKPGRYTLASSSDTLMTMIGRAGGLNNDAASHIILIPAPEGTATRYNGQSSQLDGTTRGPALDQANAASFSRTALLQPSESGLNRPAFREATINLNGADGQRYLELPARPGDTIIVPAAGQVTVEGWVDKPGAFPITSGMTALGAIAAAGGARFSSQATVVREQGDGSKLDLPLDLAKVKKGEEADVPLKAGDIVVVESSAIGAVPYSLYFLANHFGTGMFLPIP